MFNLPGDTNRHAIIGMTGSGKTHAALWHLSLRSFNVMPWIIFDFKLDDNIAQIPGLNRVDIHEKLPTHPGLYAVSPLPHEKQAVDDYLWMIHQQEYTGVYIDEGYEVDRLSKAMRAILTQGRSKRIPTIMLTQRPSWINPFLLGESEFLQLYYIHNPTDVKTMREWMPLTHIPRDFESLYYDVKANRLTHLAPMPPMEEIMQRFDDKRPRRRRPIL